MNYFLWTNVEKHVNFTFWSTLREIGIAMSVQLCRDWIGGSLSVFALIWGDL